MPDPTPSDKLRARLAELGLTQRAAAAELGIDERSMRRYCAGTRGIPQVVWLAMEALSYRQARQDAG